jgi:arylsulfatase A-like enzyme
MRIIYIDIDSTRPDHLGCYGYKRATTPHLDAIAAEGVRFTQCYVSDAPCLPSRTAFFGGRFGIVTGVVNHGGTQADLPVEGPGRGFASASTSNTLAEALRRAGWYTGSISPFPHRHSAYQIWEGFHELYDTGGDGSESADVVFPYVERWLAAHAARDRWFLHVNLWDPHTPYDTPLAYGQPFDVAPAPAWVTQERLDAQRASYGPHDAVTPYGAESENPAALQDGRELGAPFNWPRGARTIADLRDWKAWIDGYDTGLRYADHYIGQIVARLRQQGIYDDTALIISADHGENQGELGVYGDHQTADHCTCHVPLIVRWPGLTDGQAGQAVDDLFYQVDLAATLVELAGGVAPQSWDGLSFAPALATGQLQGRPYLVVSQGAWSCQRGVRWGDHLLIRTYHTGYKPYPALLLFDLRTDPHETQDLARQCPDVVGEGLRLLDRWVADRLGESGRPDPLFAVMAEGGPYHARDLGPLAAVLRRSGRAAHAEWLERHGGQPRES